MDIRRNPLPHGIRFHGEVNSFYPTKNILRPRSALACNLFSNKISARWAYVTMLVLMANLCRANQKSGPISRHQKMNSISKK
jgi:hypothetical protein